MSNINPDAARLAAALQYAHDHQDQALEELKSLVRIPSISNDKSCKPEMERAAHWLIEQLQQLGFHKVQMFQTAGAPIVYAELLTAGPNKPTALIYGHYDVQPAEPLELWESLPFEPEVRGELLFGRGASDMKGQIVAVLAALNALAQTGDLPVNLKFLLEGEEEVGSPNLDAFIISHAELLSSDFVLNPDSGMVSQDHPTITYGLRGIAYFEIRVTGPDHDLHSGIFGGIVHNPAQVLCELIAGMHDAAGRVTLPGFYDQVRPLEDSERAELRRLPINEVYYRSQTGCSEFFGEEGYTLIERATARPTLEVNGLLSGFTGEGSKTVLPARAMAKISARLVPDQDPYEVQRQLSQYLHEHAPSTVRWEMTLHSAGYPSITDLDHFAIKAMQQALEDTWGSRPLVKREGGSIPVVASMQKHLGLESVLAGFSLPEDGAHAPNERLHLPTFERGVQALVRCCTYL